MLGITQSYIILYHTMLLLPLMWREPIEAPHRAEREWLPWTQWAGRTPDPGKPVLGVPTRTDAHVWAELPARTRSAQQQCLFPVGGDSQAG